ncbi:MAG TPA: LytTR family transcriptional regulator DNA-binding domain-containing protein [Bacteroidales bacterium]|nr:LytTR family transcriptional regulator DNA-binding domain-containing protein [Bacteroidales bacterium]
MSNRLDRFILRLRPEIGLSLKIGFSIYIFILFFSPFPFELSDNDNRIIIESGYGFISFLVLVLVRVASKWLFEVSSKDDEGKIFPSYLNGAAVFLLSALSFAFYTLHFVSGGFTFLVFIRIVVISLFLSIAPALYDSFNSLRKHNEQLVAARKDIQKQIEKFEEDNLNRSVEFISETSNERFMLLVSDIVYIKSADNYVEIVYSEGDVFRKKLIRNTLKNIEAQIRQYSNFIRCHRICIVNMHFVEKLHRDSNHYRLILKGTMEELPVSRQYLLKVQETVQG